MKLTRNMGNTECLSGKTHGIFTVFMFEILKNTTEINTNKFLQHCIIKYTTCKTIAVRIKDKVKGPTQH